MSDDTDYKGISIKNDKVVLLIIGQDRNIQTIKININEEVVLNKTK